MTCARQDMAARGAALGPLTRLQKTRVCVLARRAWLGLGRPGYADQAPNLPDWMRLTEQEAFTLWRQAEQRKAVGVSHLTAASNRDYPELMAHFARLAGQEAGARRWELRAVGDEHRMALAKLRQEMDRERDTIERPEEYVGRIAICKFKTNDFRALSPRQIWTLVFDLRRAAQRRRRERGHK